MASFILKGLVTNDGTVKNGIDRLREGNQRRRRRAYAPTSNAASHDSLMVSFSFPYEYGAGRRSSAINRMYRNITII